MASREMMAGWADMDFNGHMKNTAFLDKSADSRMMFFAERGFPMAEFVRLRLGPVIMKDEVAYFREVALLETIRVDLALAGLAADGSRFTLQNEIFRHDGRLAARVVSTGGWLDLGARKLVAPPPALLAALEGLDRTPEFVAHPSSVR